MVNDQKVSPFSFIAAAKISFLPVFGALVIYTALDQFINSKIQQILQSQDGISQTIWFWATLAIALSLLAPLFTSFIACFAFSKTLKNDQNLSAYVFADSHIEFSNKFELSLIETLRAWGKTFLWCFAFVIPGLIKYTYYLMTPFVVFFSKKYSRGEVDALEMSEKISKDFWWRLNFILFIFYFIIPLTMTSFFDSSKKISSTPVLACVIIAAETFWLLLMHYYLLKNFLFHLKKHDEIIGSP